MDVFKVRDTVIDDYRSFTTASIDIKDARLKHHYETELDGDRQWPEPWISLNPSFASGGRIDDLVREGLLHPECERIFRVKEHLEDPGRSPKRKDLAVHGTYRTKDLILSIFDEMQAAMATGTEYRSPLEQEQS